MRSILVTGGAGFIGSHLGEALLARGSRLRVLDDFSNGRRFNLPAGDYELMEGDLRDPDQVESCMSGVHLVLHQAALVSVPLSIDNPLSCYETNVQGTLNLLSAALQNGVDRIVLASSSAVYGQSDRPVAEDGPKAPLSPYAASKLAMEEAALMYHRVYGLPVVCLRYFNVYGPRQRPDSPYAAVIPAFIQSMLAGKPPVIFGDGNQRRDFVHVADVVRANLLAAESDSAVGQVLNISGGGAVTINELAEILQGFLPDAPAPVHAPPREGDIYFSEAALDRAERALGYRTAVGLEEGLRSTVEWFLQERLKTTP